MVDPANKQTGDGTPPNGAAPQHLSSDPNPNPEKEPRFSQEQVNSIVANTKRQIEQTYGTQVSELQTKIAELEGAAPEAKSTKSKGMTEDRIAEMISTAVSAAVDGISAKTTADARSAALEGFFASHSVPEAAQNALRAAFEADKPEDAKVWFASTAEAFGFKPAGDSKPKSTPMSSTPPSPFDGVQHGTTNPSDLTKEQVDQMGPDKVDAYVRKHFGIGQD